MQRFFIEDFVGQLGDRLEAPAPIAYQLTKVLRARTGDRVLIVDQAHQTFLASLDMTDHPSMELVEKLEEAVEAPVKTRLYLALTKGDKLDWTVQKATELGVSSIHLVDMKWSQVSWAADKQAKKITRLQKIAQEASEQSHRTAIPPIEGVFSLKEAIQEAQQAQLALVAYEESAKQGEDSVFATSLAKLEPGQDLAIFFGPEGGISPEEMDLFQEAGIQAAGLGPRILRAETAPLMALSAILYYFELREGR